MYEDINIDGHRSGWNYVTKNLKDIFTNPNGVYLNTWADCRYLFEKDYSMNGKPWVGIFHLTECSTSTYYTLCNINRLLINSNFIKDLSTCKGIFTLSTYMKTHVENLLSSINYGSIKVNVLYHPTEFVVNVFNPFDIFRINRLISLGSQLRKNTTIYMLNTRYTKNWLPGRSLERAYVLLEEECKEYNINIEPSRKPLVQIVNKLSNSEYDTILLNSFVLIDVYEASANNALIECIVRNIPCFVTKHPAIIEYIGDTYPLLFENTVQLESMIHNKELIQSAYDYLVANTQLKEKLRADYFVKSLLNSPITKSILSL